MTAGWSWTSPPTQPQRKRAGAIRHRDLRRTSRAHGRRPVSCYAVSVLGWMWMRRGLLSALLLSGCAAEGDGLADPSSTDASSSDASSSGASSSGAWTSLSTADGGASRCEDEGWDSQGDDEGAEDTAFGMGDDMPLPFAIAAVQQGEAGNGTRIALTGVIVVTPAAPSEVREGRELFVQDPAGGPYSGLRVVSSALDLGELLAPGDEVDLVGEVVMHDGFVLLEISASDDVMRVGPTALPEPTPVTIVDLAVDSPTARQYEGVVVHIADATVTDTAPCAGEFVLDGIVRVDDRFVPGQLAMPSDGALVSSVRGVFVRASGSYELAPPELDALVD